MLGYLAFWAVRFLRIGLRGLFETELHGSLATSFPWENARGFNADLLENRNRLRGFPGVQVSL